MTATRPRALSVAEMQAAVDALLRGDFAEPQAARFAARTGHTQQPHPQSVPVARRGQAGGGRRVGGGCPLPGRVVLVLAGHPGVGASTVALLLGEAAATSGAAVRLIDCRPHPIRDHRGV
jgi:Mrp family chromosome partitioning ATPase